MAEKIKFLDGWRALDVGGWIADHLSILPPTPLASHGDREPRGANAMLDAHLREEASDY